MKPDEQIFPRKVRYAGVTGWLSSGGEDEETAAKAIKLIQVEYEELPVVVDVEGASRRGLSIHGQGNLLGTLEVKAGEMWIRLLKESDYVYEGRYSDRLSTIMPWNPMHRGCRL